MNMSQTAGVTSEITATPRNIFWSADNAVYIPGGRTIAGALSRDPLNTVNPEVLRAGVILGMNNTTKKLQPAIIGLLYITKAGSATSVIVSTATGNEIERRIAEGGPSTIIIVGPPANAYDAVAVSAALTITAIGVSNGTTRTLTVSANAEAAMLAGSLICAGDGYTHIPIAILNEPYGIKVTDPNNVSMDVEGSAVLIGGLIKTSSLINYPGATFTTLIAWIKQYLKFSAGFAFDDDFGAA
jgi:hypothetical protein